MVGTEILKFSKGVLMTNKEFRDIYDGLPPVDRKPFFIWFLFFNLMARIAWAVFMYVTMLKIELFF